MRGAKVSTRHYPVKVTVSLLHPLHTRVYSRQCGTSIYEVPCSCASEWFEARYYPAWTSLWIFQAAFIFVSLFRYLSYLAVSC
jgi:hypothetical protein